MALIELSDMLGAIEAYAARHNVTLYDLMIMMKATQSAFKDGSRPSRETCAIEHKLTRWRCRRCESIVVETPDGKRCRCGVGPSPWEPI